MKLRTQLTAALAALVLLSIAATTAIGYTGTVGGSITVSGTPICEPFTMTATVLDGAGAPVVGQSVAWEFVPSASDVISPTPTITDSKGKATTTVTFAPVSGTRVIRATAGSVSASAVLSPATCESDSGSGSVESAGGTPRPEGLPSTSTRPAGSSGGTPITALFLVAIGALAGALALRHRVAATRS